MCFYALNGLIETFFEKPRLADLSSKAYFSLCYYYFGLEFIYHLSDISIPLWYDWELYWDLQQRRNAPGWVCSCCWEIWG